MRRILLLTLLGLVLAGCSDTNPVIYRTVTDTLYVCPDSCDRDDDKKCDKERKD